MRANRAEGTKRVHASTELNGLELAAVIEFQEICYGEPIAAGNGNRIKGAVRHDVVWGSKAGHGDSEFRMSAIRSLLFIRGPQHAVGLSGVITEVAAKRDSASGEHGLLHFERGLNV